MAIPLISLIALWAYAATSSIGGALAQRAYDTENSATGAPDSALLDQLIQERTLTYIWMSSGRRASPAAMLNSLAGIRTAADKGTMSPLAVFQAYNAIVDAQFQFFRGEAVISDGPISLYQEGAANIDAGQALELVGREAALVGGALASGGAMSKATRDQFAQDVYDQRLLEQDTLSPVSWPGTTSPYTHLFASATYTDFAAMENRIIDTTPGARIPVGPATWQSGVTSFLGALTQSRTSAGKATPRAPPTSAMSSCSS